MIVRNSGGGGQRLGLSLSKQREKKRRKESKRRENHPSECEKKKRPNRELKSKKRGWRRTLPPLGENNNQAKLSKSQTGRSSQKGTFDGKLQMERGMGTSAMRKHRFRTLPKKK